MNGNNIILDNCSMSALCPCNECKERKEE